MKSVEFKEFIAWLMRFSSFIRVVQADKLFGQGRKKFYLFSFFRVNEHNGFSAKYQYPQNSV